MYRVEGSKKQTDFHTSGIETFMMIEENFCCIYEDLNCHDKTDNLLTKA